MSDTFVFDGMTPELRAYLDHCGKTRDGEWRKELDRLCAMTPRDVLERYSYDRKRWYCRDETQDGEPVTHTSPSGRYRLVVTRHATGKGTWSYSKGRVFDDDRLVAEVCRNYHSFLFCFVEGHTNGHDYLVTGEDYQGQTFIELDTGRRVDHLPKSASHGFGFCWAKITPSPSKRTLAVNGCFWAAPYEVWFVNFDDPMSGPPIVLKREADADSFIGWTDDDTAEYGRTCEVYTANNKNIDECTLEELDEWQRREDAGENVTDERRDAVVRWERPSPYDAARAYVVELRKGWVDDGRALPEEYRENARRLLARLTDEERATLPSLDDKLTVTPDDTTNGETT